MPDTVPNVEDVMEYRLDAESQGRAATGLDGPLTGR